MAEGIYVPRHDTQYEPRTACSPYDCNMAASADALRWWSLGLQDQNHNQLRALQPGGTAECTDSSAANNGTSVYDGLLVLQHFGVRAIAYGHYDGKTFADILGALNRGETVTAMGDYGSVPIALRGPISRNFTGGHSVFFQRRISYGGQACIRVGDGLSDDWMYWPETVAKKYVDDFPGSVQFVRIITRKLASKSGITNVRAAATRQSAILTTITTSSRLHYGGAVLGETIGTNRTWYKVYAGTKGIGYVHSSVGAIVA